jgi:hypothetical protein
MFSLVISFIGAAPGSAPVSLALVLLQDAMNTANVPPNKMTNGVFILVCFKF